MDKYKSAITYILEEQESIIGPIAKDLANQVEGMHWDNNAISITADPKMTLEKFVSQFQTLFGPLSIEVSKRVIKTRGLLFNPGELPDILN